MLGDITFPGHSGFGNQVQQLLAALYLAHESQRTLVMPPLLAFSSDGTRSASLNLEDARTADAALRMRSCANGTYDGRKLELLLRAEEQHALMCACVRNGSACVHQRGTVRLAYKYARMSRTSGRLLRYVQLASASLAGGVVAEGAGRARPRTSLRSALNQLDLAGWRASSAEQPELRVASFERIYDFSGFAVRTRACSEGQLCARLDATLMNNAEPAAGAWCDFGATRPSCADLPRIVAAASAHRAAAGGGQAPLVCLGPLNDYFLVDVLERCACEQPLAATLLARGLPLAPPVRPWAEEHLSQPHRIVRGLVMPHV